MAPMCEQCIRLHNVTPLRHCPFGEDLHACRSHFFPSQYPRDQPLLDAGGCYPLPDASNGNAMDRFRIANARTEGTCQACGCGDNTIGHWTRWCVVPLLVVWIILQPSGTLHCLSDIATISAAYNAICTLTLAAFRRLLRQEGAFYHQTPNEVKSVGWWIDTLLAAVAQDAPQELEVPFFRAISGTPARLTLTVLCSIVSSQLILKPCTCLPLFVPFEMLVTQVTGLLCYLLTPFSVLSLERCNATHQSSNKTCCYRCSIVLAANTMFRSPSPHNVQQGIYLSLASSGTQKYLCSSMDLPITM